MHTACEVCIHLAFGFTCIYVQVVFGKGPGKTAAPNSNNTSATAASAAAAPKVEAKSEPESMSL